MNFTLKSALPLLVALFALTAVSAQQEHQYTMSMYNKLYYNPAYAGIRGISTAQVTYRKQHFELDGSPESRRLDFNGPITKDKKASIGIGLSNVTLGHQTNWVGTMAYAYQIGITDETSLSLGVQGSINNYGFDFTDAVINEGGDPSVLENTDVQTVKANFGAGLYLLHKNFYFGLSVPNMLKNEIGTNEDINITDAEIVQHYYVMTGLILPVGKQFQLLPSALAKYVNNAPFDLEASLRLVYENRVMTGIGYRLGGIDSGESLDIMMLYQFGQLGLGISYDLPMGQLSNYTVGSLEALVRYDITKVSDNLANPRIWN